jgi:hypothetical protein
LTKQRQDPAVAICATSRRRGKAKSEAMTISDAGPGPRALGSRRPLAIFADGDVGGVMVVEQWPDR